MRLVVVRGYDGTSGREQLFWGAWRFCTMMRMGREVLAALGKWLYVFALQQGMLRAAAVVLAAIIG